ncbi:hypothetical protein SK128_022018 [Halocaridina rubra]|uniref:Uncharacterized protein n=1 Tax=Halocaridina rubra TaxID=373956 RepID=A0AAN8ZW18_HALRR
MALFLESNICTHICSLFACFLLGPFSSKYFYSPFMLTPSPNPDTDVLLPPPNFTLGQSHGRSRGTLLASRQHPIRKSTIYSDMEDDSTGGSMDDPPVVPTHSSIGKSYPGMAIPVKQKSHSHLEVGPEAKDKSKARAEATDSRPADLFDTAKVTAPSRFFQECFPLRDTSNISDLPHLETSHSLDEVELSSSTLTPDYLQDKMTAKSAPQSRGTSPSTNKLPSLQSFILSPKKSPVKSDPIPIPRKAFSSHSRSKSSVALKPERAFELAQSARDDISLLQRETSNMTLGGSNIYELLSKTTQVSPSHTEMCLTYMPKKPEAPSSWERSRGHSRNEHLFTSRSLERPSTPKHNKHLSSIHKVSSLPLQHTRDRSPSPVRNPSHWRLERQAAQFVRENTYDLKDMELGYYFWVTNLVASVEMVDVQKNKLSNYNI